MKVKQLTVGIEVTYVNLCKSGSYLIVTFSWGLIFY